MASVSRFDLSRIGSVEKTSRGGRVIDAAMTRSGVFVYRRDGIEEREWRPESEVFDAASLASLSDAPVTVLHPEAMVTSDTYKRDSVGHVRAGVQRSGTLATGKVVVEDADAVRRIDARELVEISCGYTCDMELTSGVTPEGERYDAIQRNVRYNHVALGPRGWGRAGGEVSLRLDGGAAFTRLDDVAESRREGKSMAVEKIDGIELEIGSAPWKQAREKQNSAREKELTELRDQLAKTTARADSADRRVAQLEASSTPAAIAARVAARVDLESRVRPILGASVKLDGKSDDELMAAVVTKLDPAFRLDAIDEASRPVYLRARFDAEARRAVSAPSESFRESLRADARETDDVSGYSPLALAYFETANANAHKGNA